MTEHECSIFILNAFQSSTLLGKVSMLLPATNILLAPSANLLRRPTFNLYFFAGDGAPASPFRTVRCMAKERRVRMVAKQIRREISEMLLTDKVLQFAVLPEASLGADRYLSSLTTISDVEVSADLQVVKVYVSVFGDERGREVAITGLKSKAKYVRSELGKRMKLRIAPEIRFIEDESLERGSRVIAILDRLKDENNNKDLQSPGSLQSEPSSFSDTNGDGSMEDPEDGIIHIK